MSARMNRILISIFAVLLVTNKGFTTEAPAESSPQWIAHVSSPRPDYPVIGYSLFDRLFLKNTRGNREYAIPFPFDALIANFEKRVDNDKRSSVPHGLIPIGRSLQREIESEHYRAICKLDNNMNNLPPVTYRFDCINQSSPRPLTATIQIEHQNMTLYL